jgi:ERCC4-related helicase
LFVGKKDSYTRKQQEETIQDFRDEKFDALISSSIAEEGLQGLKMAIPFVIGLVCAIGLSTMLAI